MQSPSTFLPSIYKRRRNLPISFPSLRTIHHKLSEYHLLRHTGTAPRLRVIRLLSPMAQLPIVRWAQPLVQFRDRQDFHAFESLSRPSQAQRDANGDVLIMRTPNGQRVYVWVSDQNPETPAECRYYCHGWGLGTYDPANNVGYTIMSTFVHVVLRDPALAQNIVPESKETIIATNPHVNNLTMDQIFGANPVDVNTDPNYAGHWNIKISDVVAWWGQNTQTPLIKRLHLPKSNLICMHTAVITQPVFKARKVGILKNKVEWYLSKDTSMSSKNGPQIFLENTTLRAVMKVYKQFPTIGIYRLEPIPGPGAQQAQPAPAEVQAVQHAIAANEAEIANMTADGAIVPDQDQI